MAPTLVRLNVRAVIGGTGRACKGVDLSQCGNRPFRSVKLVNYSRSCWVAAVKYRDNHWRRYGKVDVAGTVHVHSPGHHVSDAHLQVLKHLSFDRKIALLYRGVNKVAGKDKYIGAYRGNIGRRAEAIGISWNQSRLRRNRTLERETEGT